MKLKFFLSPKFGANEERLSSLVFGSCGVRVLSNGAVNSAPKLQEQNNEATNLKDPQGEKGDNGSTLSPAASGGSPGNESFQKLSSRTQSFDLLRSLSSSWRWASSSSTKPNNSSPPNESENTVGPETDEATTAKEEVWPDVLVKDNPRVILDRRRGSTDHGVSASEVMLQKLIATTSGISKVAKLAILNEELAKNPNFLDPLQKGKLAKHLLKKKEEIPGKRFQQSVRCTFNLLGIPEKPRGSGIRILSVDGGGTRGLVPLEILNYLDQRWSLKRRGGGGSGTPAEDEVGKEKMMETFIQQFDLVCGVSTGSIVVFMTAVAGINFPTSIQLYRKMAAEIFQRSSILGVGSTLYGSSWYDTVKWTKHLQSYERSFDPLFMASKDKKTPMVCAVSAVTNDDVLKPLVFRSYNFLPHSQSRYLGTSAAENWQAVRASTAAPFYFDPYKYLDRELQDGGLLLNNPTALAVHEARALWPNEELQLVLSLGTGIQASGSSSTTDGSTGIPVSLEDGKGAKLTGSLGGASSGSGRKGGGGDDAAGIEGGAGVSGWRRTFSHFFDSVTDTEIIHTTLKDLLPRGVYYRFNPRLNNKVFMDEFREEKLNGLREETLKYMHHHSKRVDRFVETINKPRSTTSKIRDLWHQTSLESAFTKTKAPR